MLLDCPAHHPRNLGVGRGPLVDRNLHAGRTLRAGRNHNLSCCFSGLEGVTIQDHRHPGRKGNLQI